MWILYLLIATFLIDGTYEQSQGKSCFGGIATFEKTYGVHFNVSPSHELNGKGKQMVTPDCAALCTQSNSCTAFSIEYKSGSCLAYDRDSIGRRDLLIAHSGTNYLEEVCFRGVNHYNTVCGNRIWAFERIIGAYLEGFDDKEEKNVVSKVDCEKLCLLESFCRSAEYDELQQICRLSREDKRTKPAAFKYSPGHSIDYLENQCFKIGSACKFEIVTNVGLTSLDDIQYTGNANDCQKICSQSPLFTCWTFAYDNVNSKCYLSGEPSSDGVTSESLLPADEGWTFGERRCATDPCLNGSVTFEKVSGYTLRSSMLETIPVNKVGQGVTVDCLQHCKQLNLQCSAVIVDHVNNKCFRINRGSQELDDIIPFKMHSYFEKHCLRGIRYRCRDKAWTFERVPMHELLGFDNKVITGTLSRHECAELCLQETSFECRSAEYVYAAAECRLSSFDRRDKPYAFRASKEKIDYLENQCAPSYFEYQVQQKEYVSPTFVEQIQTQVNIIDDCINICATFHKFTCRTAGYRPQSGECLLSSEDFTTAANRFSENHPDTILIERKPDVVDNKKSSFAPVAPGFPIPDLSHLWNYFTKSIFASTTPAPTVSTLSTKRAIHVTTERSVPVYQGGRCPSPVFGFTEYEKVTGYMLKTTLTTIQLSSTMSEAEIVQKCKDFCNLNRNCLSFNINYDNSQCTSLARDSLSSLSTFINLEGNAYFEPICFQSRGCGRLWTFERHLNKTLIGHTKATFVGITRAECQEKCLFESQFSCNSASYDHIEMECRLSNEDRFTKPFAFANAPHTDYLENQCSRNLTMRQRFPCQYAAIERNKILVYADKVTSVTSESECRKACETELQFVCRSYSFIPIHTQNLLKPPDCHLSADTRLSDGAIMKQYSGAIYVERICSIEYLGTPMQNATGSESKSDPAHEEKETPTESSQLTSIFATSSSSSTKPQPTSPTTTQSAAPEKPFKTPSKLAPVQPMVPTDQSCSNAIGSAYERTMSFTAQQTASMEVILVSSTSKDVIFDCLQSCSYKGGQCIAFTVQYPVSSSYTTCIAINDTTQKLRSQLVQKSGAAYFEKICLKSVRSCGKQWTFERVIGFYLNDTYGRQLYLKSKDECEESCLLETTLPCRSVSYIYSQQTCLLSSETRRTRPEAFQFVGNDADYIENQCFLETNSGEYIQHQHQFNPFINRLLMSVANADECKSACDQEIHFVCRSISFDVASKMCYLSAEDKFTITNGKNIIQRFGILYAEKTGYNQVKVSCSQADIFVTLQFDEPFNGIIYAKGNPLQCYFPGNSQSVITITLPIGTRCGTVEESPGRYRNDVVIQQHSLIMTASDKIFRIVCSSSLVDKTVKVPTDGRTAVNVAYGDAQMAAPPTLLSNVAIAPHVQMRITDARGREVNSVNIGDQLYLRIEPAPFSTFGLFAKNLIARSEFLEYIVLIDNNGCSIDPYVFPTFELDKSSKALIGPFNAFRFASTGMLYFEVEIQFCQNTCLMPTCERNSTRNRHKPRDLDHKNPTENENSTTNSHPYSTEFNQNQSIEYQQTLTNHDHVKTITNFSQSEPYQIFYGGIISTSPLPLRKPLRVS